MPRARLLDARCLTHVDLPILPFLAPRVLSGSPFWQEYLPISGHSFADKQQKENAKRSPANGALLARSKTYSWSAHATNISACHGLRSTIATSHPAGRLNTSGSYAPLKLQRCYTTKVNTESTSLATSVQNLPSTRKRLQPFGIQSTTAKSAVLGNNNAVFRAARHDGKTRAPKSSGAPPELGDVLGLPGRPERALIRRRRLKNLQLEITRYLGLLDRLSYVPARQLVRIARYRSLGRRIINLQRNHTETVHLTRGLAPNNQTVGDSVIWKAFAALDRRVYSKSKRRTHVLTICHDPSCEQWAKELCKDASVDDTEKMWTNWLAFDQEERNKNWHLLLLFLLDKRPDRALQFLRVLTHEPYVETWRPEIIADAFEHLARLCTHGHSRMLPFPNASYLVPTFGYVFREHLAEFPSVCSQDLLWNVARLASPSELKSIFDELVERKAFMDYDTLLHYANRFGEAGEHQYALRCLQKTISRSKHLQHTQMIARQRFHWSCALILRRSGSGQNYHLTNQIVADIIALGVKLDILLYNVIMHNAMDAADPATALRVYNILAENGVKPNKHTYSIILHGCTKTSDPASYREIAESCAHAAKTLNDPWLATDYLYYMYTLHHKESPEHVQTVLIRTYAQLFTVGALEPFGSYSESQAWKSASEGGVGAGTLEPTSMAVYIMLQAEIQKVFAMGNSQTLGLFSYFKHLLVQGQHPALNALGRLPYIWNAFLLAFCKRQQFQSASQLIKDMTDGGPLHIPPPNLYSWNMFMQAFFKTDQVRAAERIHEIMRRRGVEPDQFTYGVLLMGYAKAQHLDRLSDVMQHVDDESGIDSVLLQSLMQVHDRKRLMVKLENARQMKEEKRRQGMAAAELEKEQVWMRPDFTSVLNKSKSSALSMLNSGEGGQS